MIITILHAKQPSFQGYEVLPKVTPSVGISTWCHLTLDDIPLTEITLEPLLAGNLGLHPGGGTGYWASGPWASPYISSQVQVEFQHFPREAAWVLVLEAASYQATRLQFLECRLWFPRKQGSGVAGRNFPPSASQQPEVLPP